MALQHTPKIERTKRDPGSNARGNKQAANKHRRQYRGAIIREALRHGH